MLKFDTIYCSLFMCFVFTLSVFGDVDFKDCGSKKLFVDFIDIPGCDYAPCYVRRGFSYHVYITPDYLEPQVDNVELSAYVRFFGALFPLLATCLNPCGTICPLQYRLDRPRLDFIIEFPPTLLRHPAELLIGATYKNRGSKKSNMCVLINVRLM